MLCLGFIGFALGAVPAWSAQLTYYGRLLNSAGQAVAANPVKFKVLVRTPGTENCLLYQEEHWIDMLTSDGVFALRLGGDTVHFANTEPFTLLQSFQNRGTLSFTAGKCAGGGTSYVTAPDVGRRLVIEFDDGSGWEPMPDQTIAQVPQALESMTVGGFGAAGLMRVANGSGVPQSVAALTQAQYDELVSLADGASTNYVPATDPRMTNARAPTAHGHVYSDLQNGAGAYLNYRPNNVACADQQVLKWNDGPSRWECANDAGPAAETDPTVQAYAKNAPGADFSVPANVLTLNTVPVTKGGTGLTATGTANQILGTNAAGNAYEQKTLVQGAGVTITHGAGTVTISASGGSESTTVANVGTAGVGLYKQLNGAEIQLRNVNAASGAVTVALDAPTNEVRVGVNAELAGLAGLNSNGFLKRTGAGTYSPQASIGFGDLGAGAFANNTGLIVSDGTNFQSKACLPNEGLKWLSPTGWTCAAEGDPKVGANTANMLSKWDGSALVASGVYESGGNVGITLSVPHFTTT